MLNMLPSAEKMRTEIHQTEERLRHLLRRHRLRPTKQRLVIAAYLFQGACRHVHADMLYEEIAAGGEAISVATIYNSLRHFCASGLIRAVASRGIRQWFCTDISSSCQFYFDDGGHIEPLQHCVQDIRQFANKNSVSLHLPPLSDIPPGYEISHIDISIHLEKTGRPHPSHKQSHERVI